MFSIFAAARIAGLTLDARSTSGSETIGRSGVPGSGASIAAASASSPRLDERLVLLRLFYGAADSVGDLVPAAASVSGFAATTSSSDASRSSASTSVVSSASSVSSAACARDRARELRDAPRARSPARPSFTRSSSASASASETRDERPRLRVRGLRTLM